MDASTSLLKDDLYSQIAKRVSDYKSVSDKTSIADLEDLSISLASVFSVEQSEVKIIINELMETDIKTLSPKDAFLDKCIKNSQSIICFLILTVIASYIIGSQ